MKFQTALFTQDVPSLGIVNGHVHFDLLSSAPSDIGVSAVCASATTTVLFERLQAQGTNILLSLKDGGSTMDVLSRSEGDGLDMRWDPVSLDPSQLDELQRRIQHALPLPDTRPSPAPTPVSDPVSEKLSDADVDASDDEEDDDWQSKRLLRIP